MATTQGPARGYTATKDQLLARLKRIEGQIRKLTRAESDKYFRSRPRESRLSAWISPQSAEIPDRAFLELVGKAGTHFDPNCVYAFMRMRHKIEPTIRKNQANVAIPSMPVWAIISIYWL